VDDSYSGVDWVEFQYTGPGGDPTEWMEAQAGGDPGPYWMAEVPRNDEGPTTVRWRAQDVAGGQIAYSVEYVINFNRPPEIADMAPVSPIQVREGEPVTFSVDFEDPEGDDVSIVWMIDGEVVSEDAYFSSGFAIGEHDVDLVLEDGQGNVVEATIKVSSVERTEFQSEEGWPYLMVLLVVMIAIAAIAYATKSREPRG